MNSSPSERSVREQHYEGDVNPARSTFFPSGTRVIALPSWRNPRLYFPSHGAMQRWEHSAFYPASRLSARLYRLSLRLRAVAGLTEVRTVGSSDWPQLAEFTRGVLPQVTSLVVLVGTIDPAQQITVQLRGGEGRIVGYLKYAEKVAARRRLRHEHFMLSNLSDHISPKPLKYGPLGNGEALVKCPIAGKPLRNIVPPPQGVLDLLDAFTVSAPVPLEIHPWVDGASARGKAELDPWLEALEGRAWPVVVQHGDFVPWNILRDADGSLRAIDWEYGTMEGFPYLDLVHYFLQTLGLIYRRDPLEAAECVAQYLLGRPRLALNSAQARALVRLAAYDSYRKSSEDGQHPNTGLQSWRRAIWQSKMRGI